MPIITSSATGWQTLKTFANRVMYIGVVAGLTTISATGSLAGSDKTTVSDNKMDPTCVLSNAAPPITTTASAPDPGIWQRDPKAEQEVLEASHQLHVAFDNRDVKGVADQIADQDFLFIYELTPDSKPVKLKTKQELVDWLKTSFEKFDHADEKTEAKNPVMTAMATSNFAMVTEECSLKVVRPDGSVQLQTLRATSVARKGTDGWKWIHWHMSSGAQRMVFQKGEPVELPRITTPN